MNKQCTGFTSQLFCLLLNSQTRASIFLNLIKLNSKALVRKFLSNKCFLENRNKKSSLVVIFLVSRGRHVRSCRMAITNRQHYSLSQSDDEDSLFPVRKSSRRLVFFLSCKCFCFYIKLKIFYSTPLVGTRLE